MTGEEMERAIEFILQSQAALEARMGQVDEQIERTQRQLEETNRVVQMQSVTQTKFNIAATDTLNGLSDAQSRNAETLKLSNESQRLINAALVESQKRADEALVETERRFGEALAQTERRLSQVLAESHENQRRITEALAEGQRRTDDRVDRLAETVERFIREGRNGKG